MKVKKLTKLVYLSLLYLVLAFLINFGWRLIIMKSKVVFSDRVFWALCATIILMLVYTDWICRVRNWMFPTVRKNIWRPNRKLHFVLYILAVGLPILFAHGVFLQNILKIMGYTMRRSRYWTTDFPFFIVPLLIYTVLVYFRPEYKLFKRTLPKDQPPSYLQMWEYTRDPQLLRRHLREQYPGEPLFEDRTIKLLHIVFIQLVEKHYVAYLITGEKVIIDFKASMLANWKVGRWYVKTSAKLIVNMLYINYPIVNFKKLDLEESVCSQFENKGIGQEQLDGFLTVSRRMEEHVKAFSERKNQLESEGWDERISLLH